MGKKSAPAAPDYTALAKEQASASQQLTAQQTQANRPDIYTPWGTQTWNHVKGSPGVQTWNEQRYLEQNPDVAAAIASGQIASGQAHFNQHGQREGRSTGYDTVGATDDRWESSIQLSPQQQAALDSQMEIQQGLSRGAQGLLNQAVNSFQTPTDWNALPSAADQITAPQMQGSAGDWRQRAQDATWKLQKPMLDEGRAALETRLANQGITQGSDAYNSAMRQQSDAEARAQLQAIESGRAEANMLFGQDLQSADQSLRSQLGAGNFNNQLRQQGIAENQMQRGQPLNELNALLTGQQVGMPSMPTFSNAGVGQTPQLMQAGQNQYGAAMDAFNARQSQIGGAMGGLFSLGSAALGSPTGWAGLFNFGRGG